MSLIKKGEPSIMYKFTITLLTLLFLLSGCDKKENNTTQLKTKTDINTTVSKSKATPKIEFNLKTINGKEFHITEIDNGLKFKEIKDKAIFLLFFGHKCPPCLREIPDLIDIQKKHKDLSIVALEVQGLDKEQLKSFAKSKGINYNLIELEEAMNFVNYIQAKAEWSGSIPFLIGLNRKGKVEIIHVGGIIKEQLEQVYNELIKE
jgi:thiol-disulfide isomerase/thioredoxin